MNLWESVLIALEGLAANKMRSTLTMLGVIIGVAAVIIMLAIANGARKQMMGNIQSMGTNVIFVFAGQASRGPARGALGSVQTLTLDDAEAIVDSCPSVEKAAPEMGMSAQVKYRNRNANVSVTGTTDAYLTVRNYTVEEGHFFTERDVRSARKVAVIGPVTAENLFGKGVSPVGKDIRVKGIRFRVIGKTAAKGAQGGWGDPDDQLFIPISTAMRRVFGADSIRMIGVQARSMELVSQASQEVTELLRKRHRIREGDEDDFAIRSQAEIMQMANQFSATFTILLGGVASVSLLVGGIGIMNIMLVSVTERTREIGLRMALGARRRDIQMQFLVEAMVLSLAGGLIGILLGVGLAMTVAKLPNMPPEITMFSVLLSFGFAAFVGIFFGFYPARKASRMDPIDALRYE